MPTDAITAPDAETDGQAHKWKALDELIPSLTMLEKLDLIDRITQSIRVLNINPTSPESTEETARRHGASVIQAIEDIAKLRSDAEPIEMNDRDHDRLIYAT